jgi:hypothetical protein
VCKFLRNAAARTKRRNHHTDFVSIHKYANWGKTKQKTKRRDSNGAGWSRGRLPFLVVPHLPQDHVIKNDEFGIKAACAISGCV